MAIYKMRERMLSIGDDFWIENDAGERVFKVNGKALRIRKTLKDQDATFPNQKGQPVQNPTARWVFQYFVGIHLLRIRGEGAFVLNLNDQHQQLLRLLGRSYEAFYS
mgnify:CR=1 FL=1